MPVFHGSVLCGKREGLSFLESTKGLGMKGDECKFGYKRCGGGDIDHTYCVDKNDRCPINQIGAIPFEDG